MDVMELLNKSVYGMTESEVLFMLDYYNSKEDAYMYHDKVGKLERQLVRLDSRKNRENERQEKILNTINEIESIKSKWKEHGAYFTSKPSYDKWYYNGKELYISWSGSHVHDIVKGMKEADQLFDEMVKG